MSKFKIGDRVRVVNTEWASPRNLRRTGVVEDIWHDGCMSTKFVVNFGENTSDTAFAADLELLTGEVKESTVQSTVQDKLNQIETLIKEIKEVLYK